MASKTRTPRVPETAISKDAIVTGHVEADENLRVFGLVDGSVKVRGLLIVEERGVLNADADATEIHVAGSAGGRLRAVELVVLKSTARIQGTVVAPRLIIEPGAQLLGRVETQDSMERSARGPARDVFQREETRDSTASPPRATAAREEPTQYASVDSSEPTVFEPPTQIESNAPKSKKRRLVVKVKRKPRSGLSGL